MASFGGNLGGSNLSLCVACNFFLPFFEGGVHTSTFIISHYKSQSVKEVSTN
jgi:hypothetical protein